MIFQYYFYFPFGLIPRNIVSQIFLCYFYILFNFAGHLGVQNHFMFPKYPFFLFKLGK